MSDNVKIIEELVDNECDEFADYMETYMLLRKHYTAEEVRSLMESKNHSDVGSVIKFFGRIIEHLLKIIFSTEELFKEGWRDEINEKHRFNLNKELAKSTEGTKENILSDLNANIEIVYKKGLDFYKTDTGNYPDLPPLEKIKKKIPEECPWTIYELLYEPVENLLKTLEDK